MIDDQTAAPRLLAACKAIRDTMTKFINDQDEAYCWDDFAAARAVDAAIAKAEKGTP